MKGLLISETTEMQEKIGLVLIIRAVSHTPFSQKLGLEEMTSSVAVCVSAQRRVES